MNSKIDFSVTQLVLEQSALILDPLLRGCRIAPAASSWQDNTVHHQYTQHKHTTPWVIFDSVYADIR